MKASSKTFMEPQEQEAIFVPVTEAEILKEQRSLLGLDSDSDDESLYNDDDDDDDSHSVAPPPSEEMQSSDDAKVETAEPSSPTSVLHMSKIDMHSASNERIMPSEFCPEDPRSSLMHDMDDELSPLPATDSSALSNLPEISAARSWEEIAYEVPPDDENVLASALTDAQMTRTCDLSPDSSIMADNGVDEDTPGCGSLVWDSCTDTVTVQDVLQAIEKSQKNHIFIDQVVMTNATFNDSSTPPNTPPQGLSLAKETPEPSVMDEDDLDSVEEYLGQHVERSPHPVQREDPEDLLEQFHELDDNSDSHLLLPGHDCDDIEELETELDDPKECNEAMLLDLLVSPQNAVAPESKLQQTMRRIKEIEFIGARVQLSREMDDSDGYSKGEEAEELADCQVNQEMTPEVEESAVKFEDLEAQNAMAAAEIEELKYKLSAMQATVDDLEQERNYNIAKVAEMQELLQVESEDDARAHLLVKMDQVATLTIEVDQLREALKKSDAKLEVLQQERDANRTMVVELSDVFRMAKDESPDPENHADDYAQKLRDGEVLTKDQALELTIQSLRTKVEILYGEKLDFQCTIESLNDEVRALARENEASLMKITALESQFLMLNQRDDGSDTSTSNSDPQSTVQPIGDERLTPVKVTAGLKKLRDWGLGTFRGAIVASKDQQEEEEMEDALGKEDSPEDNSGPTESEVLEEDGIPVEQEPTSAATIFDVDGSTAGLKKLRDWSLGSFRGAIVTFKDQQEEKEFMSEKEDSPDDNGSPTESDIPSKDGIPVGQGPTSAATIFDVGGPTAGLKKLRDWGLGNFRGAKVTSKDQEEEEEMQDMSEKEDFPAEKGSHTNSQIPGISVDQEPTSTPTIVNVDRPS